MQTGHCDKTKQHEASLPLLPLSLPTMKSLFSFSRISEVIHVLWLDLALLSKCFTLILSLFFNMTIYPSLHPWTHVGVYCLFLIPMHSHESTHKYCVYSFITTFFFFLFFVRSIASYYGYYLVVQSWLYNNRLKWILNSFLAENVSATCNILAEKLLFVDVPQNERFTF